MLSQRLLANSLSLMINIRNLKHFLVAGYLKNAIVDNFTP